MGIGSCLCAGQNFGVLYRVLGTLAVAFGEVTASTEGVSVHVGGIPARLRAF